MAGVAEEVVVTTQLELEMGQRPTALVPPVSQINEDGSLILQLRFNYNSIMLLRVLQSYRSF